MANSKIFEGKTTNEAIEKGLKELHTTKDHVEIKVIEEEKRSFFSILDPRVVKVEITLKDEQNNSVHKNYDSKNKVEKTEITKEEIDKITADVNEFVGKIVDLLPSENIKYSVLYDNGFININITGDNLNYLIGYRGEALNAFQTIINSFISNHISHRIKAILDIGNYKEKRKVTLENLAERTANNVIKNHKQVTLEPMQAYERKIIHTKLQDNDKIKTYSVGEEPHRRLVIAPR